MCGDSAGTLTGVIGITFALYSEQAGGPARWIETQNVTTDTNGHYTRLQGTATYQRIKNKLRFFGVPEQSLTNALNFFIRFFRVLGILDSLHLHHLVEQRAGVMQARIRIALVSRIALRFFQRHQLESLLL
jgi:hypothetical protein